MKRKIYMLTALMLAGAIAVYAQDSASKNAADVAELKTNVNFAWTMIAAFLVFFMQAGFAMVETGLTRAKNAVNIVMKNLMDFAVGSLVYWIIGFGLMFGVSFMGLFGTTGFLFSDLLKDGDPWTYAFWMFQVVFAATSATIVSGAMAERTKFVSYLIYSAVISAFIYPVFGSWVWGGLFHGSGWLEKLGFIDFAGSTVVHSVGGWAALAGAVVVGPRIGKYTKDGKPVAIPGHNLVLAALGTFILWFGWFGFNPGSTMAATSDIARIAVTTNLSGAAGAVSAMITAWIALGKPDGSMTLNGALAGLVSITAGCANVSPLSAVIIGLLAGILVVYSVLFIERVLKVDDPVGAVSVHGVCGAFGTIMVGIFNADGFTWSGLGVQMLGAVTAFLWVFPLAFSLFKILEKTVGLRVTAKEELEGLDVGEHGMEAYPDFEKVSF